MKKTFLLAGLLCFFVLIAACGNDQEQNGPHVPQEVNQEINQETDQSINRDANQTADPDDPDFSEEIADMPTRFRAFSFEYFDTLTQIIGYAYSQEEFDYFLDIILSEIRSLHLLFDIYNEYPGIANIRTINQNAGISPVEVDFPLFELIAFSIEAHFDTKGAVNIALGPVLEIWHYHRHAEIPALPDMETLYAANAYTNIHDIILDRQNSTVFLPYRNMSLDVGGVAKGFALDIAANRAIHAGFQSFLINMGGDVITANPPPGREFWGVAVEDPTGASDMIDVVSVSNMAVLVSGDYRRYFTVDGVSFSHLIDPQTLMPARHFRSVTVIHPRAIIAEFLSTAVFIMDIEEGKALLALHNADAIWYTYDGQIITTPGYSRFSERF